MSEHEPRILIHFNINKQRIENIDLPHKATEDYFFHNYDKAHHYYTVFYNKKKKLISITKHIKGTLVSEYEDEFICSPPSCKGDSIFFDCNGIKGNIYAYEKY